MTDRSESSPDDSAAAPRRVPIDRARVDELTRAIEAGRYVIDPEHIAKKLIDGGFPQEVNPE